MTVSNTTHPHSSSSVLELLTRLETVKNHDAHHIAATALSILRELTQSEAGALMIARSEEPQPLILSYTNASGKLDEPEWDTTSTGYASLFADGENMLEASWEDEEYSLQCKVAVPAPAASEGILPSLLARLAGTLTHSSLKQQLQQNTNEMHRLRLNLENSFNSIPDAIVTITEDMRILSANEAFLTLFGGNIPDYKGNTFQECFGEAAAPYESVVRQTLELGRITSHFRITSNVCGKESKLELNAAPLRTGEFSFGGAVLVIKDMTRLAVLEQQLEDRKLLNNMVGKSEAMQQVASLVNSLSNIGTTVLITGESGTGKELVADALHYTGCRADKKIVKVNCAALSESLLESELFGHVRGAFTGATCDAKGRVAAAEGGTLFLDEIGDLPLAIQLKLLRFLEYKQYERVGSSTPLYADVRVVTATNADLLQKVQEGSFRKDLYYRLNVFQIELPSLRERKEDIPLLVRSFVTTFNNELGRSIKSISPAAMDILITYDWPGNVRELRHCIEHAAILCVEEVLQPFHLPQRFRIPPQLHTSSVSCDGAYAASPSHAPSAPLPDTGTPREHTAPHVPLQVTPHVAPHVTNDTQKTDIQKLTEALELSNGKKAQAARMLGISRPTLYRWMKRAGITG